MKIATDIGFAPPVLVDSSHYNHTHPQVKELLGTHTFVVTFSLATSSISDSSGVAGLKYCAATYRLIKPVKPSTATHEQDIIIEVRYKGILFFWLPTNFDTSNLWF